MAAENWAHASFQTALTGNDGVLKPLFLFESYWRDVLALSWNIQTLVGAPAILKALKLHADHVAPCGFVIDPDRAPRAGSCVPAPRWSRPSSSSKRPRPWQRNCPADSGSGTTATG